MISDLDDSIILIRSSINSTIGTGFIVHKNENKVFVVTCSHVVEEAGGKDNVVAERFPAKVITDYTKNRDFDLVVLEIEGLLDKPKLSLDYLDEEDAVFTTIGFFNFYENSTTDREPSIRNKQIIGSIGQKSGIYSLDSNKRSYQLELNLEEENSLRRGYSGSPVFDVMRNVVVGVVNTLEGLGKKGTAISIETLKIIWEEMPPELLSPKQRALTEHSESFEDGLISNNYTKITVAALCFLLVSFISVYSSYNCFQDAKSSIYPWQEQFTESGYIWEMGRSTLYIAAELTLFFVKFPEEFTEFFLSKSTSQNERKIIKVIKIALITVIAVAFICLVFYHFVKAPQELHKWTICSELFTDTPSIGTKEGSILYKRPYFYYFPYSFINYIIIVCPVVALSLYVTVKDFFKLLVHKKEINLKIERIESVNQQLSMISFKNRKVLCTKVYRLLKKFKSDFTVIMNRYAFVFFTVLLGVVYEMLVGRETLAREAQYWCLLALILFALASCSNFLGYAYYENVLNSSKKTLVSIGCSPSETNSKNNYVYLIIDYLFSNFLFALGLVCLAIIIFVLFTEGSDIVFNGC